MNLIIEQKPIIFTEETIKDIIGTALQGASDYWLYIHIPKKLERLRLKAEYFENFLVNLLDKNHTLPAFDIETNEFLGDLSKKTIIDGTQKAIESGYLQNVSNILGGNFDGTDVDILIQFWVMKELRFG